MIRDAKLNATMACRILNAKNIPVDIPCFIGEMEKFLNKINAELDDEFDIFPVFSALADLKKMVPEFCIAVRNSQGCTDEILKRTAGELVRLTYTVSSQYYQDAAVAELPFQGLRNACGVTRTNTEDTMFVFVMTDFIRQRNRLAGQLHQVAREMKAWLKGAG